MTISFPLPSEDASAPKYMALADAIEAAAKSGALAPGDALPTHRELADAMGVTVGTVTRGYAEAARRGLVRGERGRGTFVSSQREGFATLAGLSGSEGVVDMGITAAFHSLAPDLGGTLAAIAQRDDLTDLVSRSPAQGLPRHRAAGAEWAARHGCPAEAERVLVTAGAQHALLVIMAGLFGPGDRIAVENLIYPLVKPLAKRLRLQLVPIPLDDAGMAPDALAAACTRERVRAVYVLPACQNPTTIRMPEYRRHEIVDVCRRHGVAIIEDDVYSRTVGETLPPLAALAPELTFFIAATSKVLTDSLRTSFLVAPQDAVKAMCSAIEWTSWKAAPLMAEVAARWIGDGTAERVLQANREEARARNIIVREELADFDVRTRGTGYYAWLTLPRRWRAVEFAEEAAGRGVIVAHMEHFAVGGAMPEQAVRLSLHGACGREDLRRGLIAVADLLRL